MLKLILFPLKIYEYEEYIYSNVFRDNIFRRIDEKMKKLKCHNVLIIESDIYYIPT